MISVLSSSILFSSGKPSSALHSSEEEHQDTFLKELDKLLVPSHLPL